MLIIGNQLPNRFALLVIHRKPTGFITHQIQYEFNKFVAAVDVSGGVSYSVLANVPSDLLDTKKITDDYLVNNPI
jgi:hypothetical protein